MRSFEFAIRKGNVQGKIWLLRQALNLQKRRDNTQLKETLRSFCMYSRIGEGHAQQWKHFAVTVSYVRDWERSCAAMETFRSYGQL